jgi:hypothetical protein
LNLPVYTSPGRLHAATADFIDFYNHRRYHEGLDNVTLADVYYGGLEAILARRRSGRRQPSHDGARTTAPIRGSSLRVNHPPNCRSLRHSQRC